MGFAPNLAWLFVGRALTGIAGAVYAPAMRLRGRRLAARKARAELRADRRHVRARLHRSGRRSAAFSASSGRARRSSPRPAWPRSTSCTACSCCPRACPRSAAARSRSRAPIRSARCSAFRGQRRVLGLALVAFFWQLAFHVYPATWAYFAIAKFNLSPREIGATLALSGLSMTIVQGFLDRSHRRAHRRDARRADRRRRRAWRRFLAYAFMTAALDAVSRCWPSAACRASPCRRSTR